MPGTASVSEIAIQARASIRRTPSTNTTVSGVRVSTGGRRGAHWVAGTSTSTSGSCSGVVSCDSTPVP